MAKAATPAQTAEVLPPTANTGKKAKKATTEKTGTLAVAIQAQQPAPEPSPTSESGAVLAIIERASRDPNVDIDKMERLMKMHTDLLADQRKQRFFAALALAQSEMPQVVKTAENTQTRSKYALYEKINEAMMPVITKYGFTLSFGTADCPKEGHHRITCEIGHRDGHTKMYEADIPIDDAGIQGNRNKTPTHAFASTMTYGRRILACLIFNVAVKGEDDDGNAAGGPQPKNAEPNAAGMKKTASQKQPVVPTHAAHWTDLMAEDVWKFVKMAEGHPFAGEPIWQIHNETDSFERAFKETPRGDTIDRHALDAAYASSIYRAFANKRYVLSEVEEALRANKFLEGEHATLRDVPGNQLQDLAIAVRELPKRQ